MDLPRLLRSDVPRRRPPHGRAPLVFPAALDAVAERWWALPPRWRTGALVVLALLALALVGRGATASPWGPPTTVLVAATHLPPGHAVSAADVRSASWPTDLVPDGAISSPDVAGDDLRLATAVPAGAVLTRGALVQGVAGLVDDGESAVAVPVDGLPTVAVGDVVDVVATRTDGGGARVASGARVLAHDGAFLWLGVPADAVDGVAAAGAAGRITLAVRPARPP